MENGKESKVFGLIGHQIDYSFSRRYFSEKFKSLDLGTYSYVNFDIDSIDKFSKILEENPYIAGLNVTIPYKESVMPLLGSVTGEAKHIGAVNTIAFEGKKLIGHNTDYYGFDQTIRPFITNTKALILGTGGASKAISYVFEKHNIPYNYVSRKSSQDTFTYEQLDKDIIQTHKIIVNCSPIGTFPDIHLKPSIPYQYLTSGHLLYDLIYNPEQTAFMKAGLEKGAKVLNGYDMLELQAEKAWEIWNS